jgi:HEAT repeat protein
MTTFFCPSCWKEVEEQDRVCPRCGVDIPALVQSRGYVDSLIAALSHPEPGTPIRAAWVLGQLRAAKAVEPLIRLLESDADIYQKGAAVQALGRIGDLRARPILVRLSEQEPPPLQGVLRAALERLSGPAAVSGTSSRDSA